MMLVMQILIHLLSNFIYILSLSIDMVLRVAIQMHRCGDTVNNCSDDRLDSSDDVGAGKIFRVAILSYGSGRQLQNSSAGCVKNDAFKLMNIWMKT